MLRIYRSIIFILIISLGLPALSQNTPEITTDELETHVYFLASDSLKGRKPGTPESKIAAGYIRDQFIEYGLKPIGENGFQYFDVITSVKPGENNKLVLNDSIYEMGKDFYPASFTENASQSTGIVFAGFGMDIEHDSLKWNDYQDTDVTGKWVLVLKGDPEPENDESLFISFSKDRDKALTARDREAAGVLFVKGPQFGNNNQVGDPTINRVTADVGIPVLYISKEVADQLLAKMDKTIDALEGKIIEEKMPVSFETGKNLEASADMERVEVTTQNVIAIIPGKDMLLKDEYIVIGAHYDHLGYGGPGSGSRMPDTVAIHNGADDNASGTAGIIELAERLTAEKSNFKRSVVLMAFGAEEMGLLGSQFFVSNSLVDLKDVKAMINFDMIGRLDTTDFSVMVAGTGTAIEMETMLTDYEKTSKLAFGHSPEGFGASDHSSFYASGVPVMFFSTGAHEDYHTPMDDAHKINFEGEKEILDYAYELIIDLINRDKNLTFQEAGPTQKRSGGGRGLKVKLGIMPDFTSNENNGLGVGGVTQGGPASKAGMLKGDRIVALDGKSVTNIYDYMNRLKKLKPGQTISVDIIRDDKKKVLVVVL